MSRYSNDDDDWALDAATLKALRDGDQLIPTSEAEVARAERGLPRDLELPEGLRGYRSPQPEPRRLRRVPGAVSHAAVAALAALAAGFAVYLARPVPEHPVGSAGGELLPTTKSAQAPRVPLVFRSRCESECCAGSECPSASENLRSCPSGARCIACGADYVAGGPYRLRVGTVVPSEAGQRLLPLEAPLELCVSAPTNPAQCIPALSENGGEAWRSLKQVSTVQDLLSGLSLELRKRGDATPLARWKHPVSPSHDVMCKGLAVQLSDGTDVLGRVSVFVDQTHFVELLRAASVPPLLAMLARFDVSGIEPRIHETSGAAGRRFVLVLGPVDRSEADSLRWQALDHGIEAEVGHGLDFVGRPRPTR